MTLSFSKAIPGHDLRLMFSTTFTSAKLTRAILPLALFVLVVCLPLQLHAETEVDPIQEAAIENLANIQQSIDSKRNSIRELREQLKKLDDSSEKQEVEIKIGRIKNEILGLQQSFEHIALGSINRSIFNEQPEQQINWQDELEQISRPLLSSLKQLTAKPRQIDSLRREIERQETQIKVIDKALESLQFFKGRAMPAMTTEAINQLAVDWQQRREDTQRKLEISRYKLDSLVTETTSWQASTGEAIKQFVQGRGLTLLLAIITAVSIWLVSKAMLNLYWRWLYQTRHDIGITRAPLLYYSYRLATAVIIIFSILMVLYIRGDVLFLTLALIALVGVALTMRQTLPRYAAEIRLLLGVGPVRESERLVLDGVPYIVDSLSVYTVLRNPALEGILRLPLHSMNEQVSRPVGKEPWFPCQPEDYVILANGSLARVVRQTIELVELAVMDSKVQISTREFIEQNIRNLTREGFGIASTFGIDYQHQAICLDTVPALLREAIINRFDIAGMKQDISDILVEFSSAGSSSLDYRIYLILKGSAASAFYKAQRMVQQACVETCNREGWTIPFTQVTVHTGTDDTGSALLSEKTKSAAAQAAIEVSSLQS